MRNLGFQRRRFFFIPLILLAIAVFAVISMLLWNELMPFLFHLPVISFWQALGLLILGRMFFGGFRPSGWRWNHHWSPGLQEKLIKMSPQERDEFFRKMRNRHHTWHSDKSDVQDTGESEKSQS